MNNEITNTFLTENEIGCEKVCINFLNKLKMSYKPCIHDIIVILL